MHPKAHELDLRLEHILAPSETLAASLSPAQLDALRELLSGATQRGKSAHAQDPRTFEVACREQFAVALFALVVVLSWPCCADHAACASLSLHAQWWMPRSTTRGSKNDWLQRRGSASRWNYRLRLRRVSDAWLVTDIFVFCYDLPYLKR